MKAKHKYDDAFDVASVIPLEFQRWLKQQRLQVKVILTDEFGEPVSPEVLGEVERQVADLTARMAHLRQLGALGEVSATVAHEARNLLTGVLGLSALRHAGHDHLELLRKEASRCNQLLGNFLRFTTPPTGPTVLLSANEVIEPVLLLLKAESRTRHCTLVSTIASDIPAFAGQPEKLRQILLNLTLNALQATPAGGQVELRASHTPGTIHLEVCDTGPGIPVDSLELIFEPFVSTKPPDVGTGLGLSTSRDLVESMGGSLLAFNRPNGGARFELLLPLLETLPRSWYPPAQGPE